MRSQVADWFPEESYIFGWKIITLSWHIKTTTPSINLCNGCTVLYLCLASKQISSTSRCPNHYWLWDLRRERPYLPGPTREKIILPGKNKLCVKWSYSRYDLLSINGHSVADRENLLTISRKISFKQTYISVKVSVLINMPILDMKHELIFHVNIPIQHIGINMKLWCLNIYSDQVVKELVCCPIFAWHETPWRTYDVTTLGLYLVLTVQCKNFSNFRQFPYSKVTCHFCDVARAKKRPKSLWIRLLVQNYFSC